MKKLLILVVSLIVIFALTACGSGEQNEELVGDWAWDVTTTWFYTFNADGTVVQWPNNEFEWETRGDELLITMGSSTQRWTWEIENNLLTITSNQVATLQHSYIRMD